MNTDEGSQMPSRSASLSRMTQTSPGCGLGFGILGFPLVNFLAGSEQKIVGQLHLFLFSRQLEDATGHRPSFHFAEFRQFGDDFRCAHECTIAAGTGRRNRKAQER